MSVHTMTYYGTKRSSKGKRKPIDNKSVQRETSLSKAVTVSREDPNGNLVPVRLEYYRPCHGNHKTRRSAWPGGGSEWEKYLVIDAQTDEIILDLDAGIGVPSMSPPPSN